MKPLDEAQEATEEVAAALTELADLLESLEPDAWGSPSLCAGWTVREVAAHLTLPLHHGTLSVLARLALMRFRWNELADQLARRDARRSTGELVTALRSERMRRWTPPGGGPQGALVHAVVHGLDISEPLGVTRPLSAARMRLVLAGLTAPGSLKHFGIDLGGIELRCCDVDWSHGTGTPIDTDCLSLTLMLSGRRAMPSTGRSQPR